MKYMLLIYSPENAWSIRGMAIMCRDLHGDLRGNGEKRATHLSVTSASRRDRRTRSSTRSSNLVTAGPFAETTEQLGGYYLIDVENLDIAIAIAARLPPAKIGTVEIRPIRDTANLPSSKFTIDPPDGMKKFMFLCYDDEQHWLIAGPEIHSAAIQQAVEITHRLDRNNQFVSASPLHPTSTATSVRIRDGKRLITDGPFRKLEKFSEATT